MDAAVPLDGPMSGEAAVADGRIRPTSDVVAIAAGVAFTVRCAAMALSGAGERRPEEAG